MLIRSQYHPIISSRLNQGHTWSLKYLITTANCSGALIVGNWFAQYCFRVLVEPWVLQRWQHAWWSTKCLKAKSNSSARVAASKSPICTRNLMVMISLHSYQKNFIPPVQPTGLTVYQQPSLYPYGLLAARYPWPIQPNPAVTRRSQPTGHPGDDCPCQTLWRTTPARRLTPSTPFRTGELRAVFDHRMVQRWLVPIPGLVCLIMGGHWSSLAIEDGIEGRIPVMWRLSATSIARMPPFKISIVGQVRQIESMKRNEISTCRLLRGWP